MIDYVRPLSIGAILWSVGFAFQQPHRSQTLTTLRPTAPLRFRWIPPNPVNDIRLRSFYHDSTSLSSSPSEEQREKTNEWKIASIGNAALLIAGTTVGGGFLALPTVVAPSGFAPSVTALIAVWAYFLLESLVVVECLIAARDTGKDNIQHPGIGAAAKSVFGVKGETIVVLLLVLLTEATLVSQISRAGSLFPNYRIGCTAVSLSVAAVVFGPKGTQVSTAINSILTMAFVVLSVVLFSAGAPAADWSRLTMMNASWMSLPKAIPTFLQLLVYGEILPTVCQMLNYQKGPIQLAIVLGSILPLGLEVGWAALGIGLVAPSIAMGDPVNLLLAAAGPVQKPLFALAITAILTTIIGSYLALQVTLNDLLPPTNVVEPKETPWRRHAMTTLLIVAPALAIAWISPKLFLQAIDFAGSYPVILLWGVVPPAIAILQRRQRGNMGQTQQSRIPLWLLWMLTTFSLGLFAMSAAPDLAFVARSLISLLSRPS